MWTDFRSRHSRQPGWQLTFRKDRHHASYQSNPVQALDIRTATSTFLRRNREFYEYLLRRAAIKLPLSLNLSLVISQGSWASSSIQMSFSRVAFSNHDAAHLFARPTSRKLPGPEA